MPTGPVPADPGQGGDPAWRAAVPDPGPDPGPDDDELLDAEEWLDPEDCVPPPGEDRLTAEELAEVREAARDEAAEDAGVLAAAEEFTGDELAHVLAESRSHADGMLFLALALETRLPGTKAALRDLRRLAPDHPRRRAGPDRHPGPDHHPGLR